MTNLTTIQLFRHQPSGEVYVTVTDEKGIVLRAAGPLHYTEFGQAVGGDFDNDPLTVEWINENQERFFDYQPQ